MGMTEMRNEQEKEPEILKPHIFDLMNELDYNNSRNNFAASESPTGTSEEHPASQSIECLGEVSVFGSQGLKSRRIEYNKWTEGK